MRHRPNHGAALLLVLILVGSASVLGLGYLSTRTVRLAGGRNLVLAARARYLAESALAHGMQCLRERPESVVDKPVGPFALDASTDRYGCSASLTSWKPLKRYVISGWGTVAGITQRATVKVYFEDRFDNMVRDLDARNYWRLGEWLGSTMFDSRGHTIGRYKNGVRLGQDGALYHDNNDAARFDGANDYADLGSMDLPADAMTLAAWIRPESWGKLGERDGRILAKADGLAMNDHLWALTTQADGSETRLALLLRVGGTTKKLVADSGDVQLDQWTFATAVYDGTRMRLYFNGVPAGLKEHPGTIDQDSDADAWIGGNPSGATDRPFHGVIDEVAVFRYALTDEQVEALYDARRPRVRVLSWDD